MGVSGSGKSAVGAEVADRLGWPFVEGDDLHPAANVTKMAAGHALDDADRAPWLAAVAARLRVHHDGGSSSVTSCSALRRAYREVLGAAASRVLLVELDISAAVALDRVSGRTSHFMPASLVRSQLDTLEPLQPDEPGVRVDASRPLDEVVAHVLDLVRHRAA